LYLSAGVVTEGTITTSGSNVLVATNAGYNYDYSNGFAVVATVVSYIYDYSNPVPIGGGTLNGVTLDGVLDMQSIPAATATVLGGLTLNGAITLTGPGATLDLGGGAGDVTPETIGGWGVILFGPQNADLAQNTGGGALTFGPDITLVAGGDSAINSPNAPVVNQGTIVEYAPGGMLQISAAGGFSNAGTVAIGNGALVSVGTADYTQSGGTTKVDGSLVAANVYLNGGLLTGTGTIQANVVDAALVVPGDPFGTLTVQGNYTQTATGVLIIQIAGLNQYGRLDVIGTAALDGTLVVSLGGDYVPAVGATFQILTYAGYTGGFSTELGLVLPHHHFLKPVWNSGDLTLTVSD
jgi:hypothetical protein